MGEGENVAHTPTRPHAHTPKLRCSSFIIMILMAFLVDDILLSPITLVRWIGEKVHEAATREVTDESKVQEGLLELQLLYEIGDITAEEYEQKEAELMERLEAIQKFKDQ